MLKLNEAKIVELQRQKSTEIEAFLEVPKAEGMDPPLIVDEQLDSCRYDEP